ncbi:MAG: hypothetical protein ACK5CH_08140, partial [Bacteroidota bacterium]
LTTNGVCFTAEFRGVRRRVIRRKLPGDMLHLPLRNSAVKQSHGRPGTACTCLKIMPDAEIIEKTSQFPGYFRMVNQESG